MLDLHARLPRDEKMALSGTELDQHHIPISAASVLEELWRKIRLKNKIPSSMMPSSI